MRGLFMRGTECRSRYLGRVEETRLDPRVRHDSSSLKEFLLR